VHRWLVALTLAGCAPPAAPPAPPPPPGTAIAPRAWGLGEDLGRFGRGQAAQVTEPLRVVGAAGSAAPTVRASDETVAVRDSDGGVRALLAVAPDASVAIGERA
jgi:hypothetical protein